MITNAQVPELRKLALDAFIERDFNKKMGLSQSLRAQLATFSVATDIVYPEPIGVPSWPEKPELRGHLDVPKRSPFATEGLAALLHAVTYIEFNAIKNAPFSTAFHTVMHLANNCFRPETVIEQCECGYPWLR